MKSFAICILCSVASTTFAGPAFGVSVEEFLKEYPPAAARLENSYKQVQLIGKEDVIDQQGAFSCGKSITLLRDKESVRSDSTVITSADPHQPIGSKFSFGGNKSLVFNVFKAQDDAAYMFRHYGPDPDFDAKVPIQLMPLYGTYSIYQVRVVDLLTNPTIRVVAVTPEKLNEIDCCKVTLELIPPKDSVVDGLATTLPLSETGHWFREIVFDPHSWAILKWSIFSGDKLAESSGLMQTFQCTISYVPHSDPPVITSMDTWQEFPGHSGFRSNERKYNFESVRFGPRQPVEFTPAALGITGTPEAEKH